jgi:hypothetical protein
VGVSICTFAGRILEADREGCSSSTQACSSLEALVRTLHEVVTCLELDMDRTLGCMGAVVNSTHRTRITIKMTGSMDRSSTLLRTSLSHSTLPRRKTTNKWIQICTTPQAGISTHPMTIGSHHLPIISTHSKTTTQTLMNSHRTQASTTSILTLPTTPDRQQRTSTTHTSLSKGKIAAIQEDRIEAVTRAFGNNPFFAYLCISVYKANTSEPPLVRIGTIL